MRRTGQGDYYARLVERETARLPKDVLPLWLKACGRRTASLLPLPAHSRNTHKSFNAQSPATRSITLVVINKVVQTAKAAGYYQDGFRGLIDKQVLHSLFEGPWKDLSGWRKWNICRTLWRVAWELFGLDAPWLLQGGRRLRAAKPGVIRAVDPELPKKLLERAQQMVQAAALATIDVHAAVRLRTAAHIALIAELATRLSEIALVDLPQVAMVDGQIVIVTDPAHSKVRKSGREVVSRKAAAILKAYLDHGRPVLLARADGAAEDALWITVDGLKAEAATMAAALRRYTRDLCANGVASGDVRRSAVSLEGQSFEDQCRMLRHTFGSVTAAMVYRQRDLTKALELNAQCAMVRDADIPSFSQPVLRKAGSSGCRGGRK